MFKGHDEHEDIIPPFEGYPGKNYSGDNILIYLNDCEVPSSTTSTTTPTTTSSTIPTTTTTEVVPTTTTTVVLGTTVPIPTTTTTILPEVEIFGTIIPSGTTTTIAPVLTAQEAELPKTGEGLSLFFAGLILVICGYLLKKAN